jgi:hypothetical protein
MPPSVVLNTPPPVVPIQYSSGRCTLPATATERPPRGGPTSRQRSAANAAVSKGAERPVPAAGCAAGRGCWATAGAAADSAALSARTPATVDRRRCGAAGWDGRDGHADASSYEGRG